MRDGHLSATMGLPHCDHTAGNEPNASSADSKGDVTHGPDRTHLAALAVHVHAQHVGMICERSISQADARCFTYAKLGPRMNEKLQFYLGPSIIICVV